MDGEDKPRLNVSSTRYNFVFPLLVIPDPDQGSRVILSYPLKRVSRIFSAYVIQEKAWMIVKFNIKSVFRYGTKKNLIPYDLKFFRNKKKMILTINIFLTSYFYSCHTMSYLSYHVKFVILSIMKMIGDKPHLTKQEAADFLGKSLSSVDRMIKNHELPGFKMGKCWFFDKTEIERHIEGNHKNTSITNKLADDKIIFKPIISPDFKIPFIESGVRAGPTGFESPAVDFVSEIDLGKHLITNKPSTYLLRVNGNSMAGSGIHDNDLLVVDRSTTPISGKIVIAVLDGEFVLVRLSKNKEAIILQSEPSNPKDFKQFVVKEWNDVKIWAVVKNIIRDI